MPFEKNEDELGALWEKAGANREQFCEAGKCDKLQSGAHRGAGNGKRADIEIDPAEAKEAEVNGNREDCAHHCEEQAGHEKKPARRIQQ